MKSAFLASDGISMSRRLLEIVRSITEACFDSAVADDAPLATQLNEAGWRHKLASALHEELEVPLTAEDLKNAESLPKLSSLVQSHLVQDPSVRSIVSVYVLVEQLVREEVAHDINYHWYAAWKGDLLHNTDSLDDVEIVLRMEQAFGFSISDQDAQEMRTVGQTVRYLWRRSCEQSFTLRQRPEDVCESAFIFHQLRRLLIIRAGVSRKSIRPSVRLAALLPSWHRGFLKEVQGIFGVDLPRANLFYKAFGMEKRTTIKELVALIVRQK